MLWVGLDLLAQSGQCYKLAMNDLTEIQFEAGNFSFWHGFGVARSKAPITSSDVANNNNDDNDDSKNASDDRAYLQEGPLLKVLLEILPNVALKRPDNPLLWMGRQLVTKTGRVRKIVLRSGRQYQCSSLHHHKFDKQSFKKRPQAIPCVVCSMFMFLPCIYIYIYLVSGLPIIYVYPSMFIL